MPQPLKYEFSEAFVVELGERLQQVDRSFSSDKFVKSVFDDEWDARELKDRMRHIAAMIGAHLPQDFPTAIRLLRQASAGFSGLPALVFPEFVEQLGLDYWDESMEALANFTILCSSEAAVRPFIRLKEPAMLQQLMTWAQSDNTHLRRLASEGCRPRLPWAPPLRRYIADPSPILPILEALKGDPELYVRRSVANNLNDISKDHPDVALELGQRWLGASVEQDWVVKHGLRTLLKGGDTDALLLFGYGDPASVRVESIHFDEPKIQIGESATLGFNVILSGKKTQKLRLEYAISFIKANGKRSKKVFQLGEKVVTPGRFSMSRKHSFRQMTTRKHYPGLHSVSVLVNGKEKGRVDFELETE